MNNFFLIAVLYVKNLSHCWLRAGSRPEAGNFVTTVHLTFFFPIGGSDSESVATRATSSDSFGPLPQALFVVAVPAGGGCSKDGCACAVLLVVVDVEMVVEVVVAAVIVLVLLLVDRPRP